MYDIRQFRPTLYVVVLLGFLSYSIAVNSPLMLLVALFFAVPNAVMVLQERFTPLPRWSANLITLLAFIYTITLFRGATGRSILVVGQFLVLLQIVKLYEQRASRDHAQLLVLSLLLMVAGAMSTASLVFGILFLVYLFLSLYCCLLFHLKVETDYAKTTFTLPEEKVNPQILRQDMRYLTRSMRKLTVLVATVSIISAVLVFVFFPRGPGSGLLAQLQFQPAGAMTGFSDEMDYQRVAAIKQNTDEVATVRLLRDGEAYVSGDSLYFRGGIFDTYTGNDTERGRWRWLRSTDPTDQPRSVSGGSSTQMQPTATRSTIFQEWRLKPTGSAALFGLAGLTMMSPQRELSFRYSLRDDVMTCETIPVQELRYTVASSGSSYPENGALNQRRLVQRAMPSTAGRIDPKIAEFARRDDVSHGLWKSRPPDLLTSPVDAEIAESVEQYLRTNFSYTLDLTNSVKLGDSDPMVAFLYDFKKGHCQYFAGAMTLMCQSLGLTARLVSGYRCDSGDYNNFGSFYVVRNSQAHAWVEVLTTNGWRTFDPTSSRTEDAEHQASAWKKLSHYFDYLQYVYTNSIIAYDNDNRQNLMLQVDARMTNSVFRTSLVARKMLRWLDPDQSPLMWNKMIGTLLFVIAAIGALAVGWFLYERWRLRKRAVRLGVETLPHDTQRRLARQLEFYDQMLRLLERRHIFARPMETHREFAKSLTYLPAEAFDIIGRLTEIFYRVRFGGVEISAPRQRQLVRAVGLLENTVPLPPKSPGRPVNAA